MSEFFEVVSPNEAISKIISHNDFPTLKSETVDTISCHNRITSENVISNSDLPHFDRSSMDGYAIKSNDSTGVSSSSPNYIKVTEEIKMGHTPSKKLKNGECARIFTGGMIPQGADSVIMEEDTEILNDNFIEIKKSLSVGENIIFKGEETKKNKLILSKGHKIRSQDIGSMLESGITKLKVYKKLIIGVLSSGDELLDPTEDLQPAKIRDINTYTISTLIKSTGHKIKNFPIMPDNFESQLDQAKKAFNECDILIFSAGSSISYRDTTSKVITNLGLPGNPVSASMIFTNIIRPIIYSTYNFEPLEPYVLCQLNDDISSHTGRVDYVPVKISSKNGISYAQPILGKSNLINTLVHSDGYITVPSEKRGLYKNSTVKVSIYE